MKTFPLALIPVTVSPVPSGTGRIAPQLFERKRTALALALTVTLLALLATPFARAQSTTSSPSAQRSDESAVGPAKAEPSVSDLPSVNHLVYLAQLPTPASLMKEAAAQGLTIQRIDRTGDSVVVTYKYTDGHTDTTGYTTLAAASTTEEPLVTGTVPAPANTAGTVTTVQSVPSYTVVSYQPAPVYYGYGPRYYYDEPLWAPLALGIGLGFVVGGHGGYYHGHGGYSGHGGFHH